MTDEFTEEPTVLKLVISPELNPKHFDTTMTKVGKHKKAINNEGAAIKDKLIPGLYKRDGDTLTICMRSPENLDDGRPKELKAGDGVVLVVLERVKDEKEERQALAGEWKVTTGDRRGEGRPGRSGRARRDGSSKRPRSRCWNRTPSHPSWAVKLDPAATPPAIDFLTTDGKEVKWKGIYFRQNDKLTVCLPLARSPRTKPTADGAEAGRRRHLHGPRTRRKAG